MLIYDALREDHDRMKALLSELVAASEDDEVTRETVIEQIRDELIPHARAEEAVFYNFLKQFESTKKLVRHSFAEHLETEGLLRSLQAMEVVNFDWQSTARKLESKLNEHIREEEENLFPVARNEISDREAELMADAFERIKPEIRKGSLMRNTLDMIANSLPERLGRPLRSFDFRTPPTNHPPL